MSGDQVWYDTSEVALRLNRRPASVRQLASTGLLRATKDGQQWLVSAEDLEDYLQSRSNRPRKYTRGRGK